MGASIPLPVECESTALPLELNPREKEEASLRGIEPRFRAINCCARPATGPKGIKELTARIELATSTLLVLRYATKLGEPYVRSGGIEPPPTAWKAAMIPFHHERKKESHRVSLRENFTTKLQGLTGPCRESNAGLSQNQRLKSFLPGSNRRPLRCNVILLRLLAQRSAD